MIMDDLMVLVFMGYCFLMLLAIAVPPGGSGQ